MSTIKLLSLFSRAITATVRTPTIQNLIYRGQLAHFCAKATDEDGALIPHYNPPINREAIRAQIRPNGKDAATLHLAMDRSSARFANSFGTLQGGFIGILHDLVASQAVYAMGRVGLHNSMNIQFLEPTPTMAGTLITGWARVIKATKRTSFVESAISVEGVTTSKAQHLFTLKDVDPTILN